MIDIGTQILIEVFLWIGFAIFKKQDNKIGKYIFGISASALFMLFAVFDIIEVVRII